MRPQNGIFVEGNRNHWFLQFSTTSFAAIPATLSPIFEAASGSTPNETVQVVVSFGADAAAALFGNDAPDVPRFDGVVGETHSAVSQEVDVSLWIHSDRHDRNFDVARTARRLFADQGELLEETVGFVYRDSRDLTGFIDGTENPEAHEAHDLVVLTEGPGVGGSFMFTQRWVHDLDAFDQHSVEAQEQVIGRTKLDSVELDPVPERSHVGRVVTEDDDGNELEIYRRSVAYGSTEEAGLQFVAFTAEPWIIDGMLDRMYGLDGPADDLLAFSRAVNGAYTFAPSSPALAALIANDAG